MQVRLDMLSDRPDRMSYFELQGTHGCYESTHADGLPNLIWLAEFGTDRKQWRQMDEQFILGHLPAEVSREWEAARQAGHHGSDHFVAKAFVNALVEDRDMPVGIHKAMDLTLPGLVSQQSIAQGGAWLPVPDSRQW